jgi:broad specificity phosphatase PhoE
MEYNMHMDQKQVYLVRHGQTDHNNQRIFQDDAARLNEVGLRQSEQTAQRLSSDIEVVISSPLERAQETAEIIANYLSCQLETNPLLVEFENPPDIRGKSYDDPTVADVYEQWCDKLLSTESYSSGGDTENYHDLIIRARQVLDMLNTRQERAIAVITHSEFMRAILACVLVGESASPEEFSYLKSHIKVHNGAIVKLRLTDEGGAKYRLVFGQE